MAPTLTSETWTQIRYDYEHTERPIAAICAEHGISSGTLRDRMRRWGWTRRRPPIPREGPPPLPAPAVEIARVGDVDASSALDGGSPHPAASRGQVYAGCVNLPAALGVDPPPPGEGEGGAGALVVAAGEDAAPSEIDDGALVPRLKGAVARVLPAIEVIVGKLAAGAMHPREMERAGRALGVLTRTLRELNALLGERRPPADTPASKPAVEEDEGPRDLEAFRIELTRRMNAIVAARTENAEGGASAEGGDMLSSSGEAESVSAPEGGSSAEFKHARPRGPQVRSV